MTSNTLAGTQDLSSILTQVKGLEEEKAKLLQVVLFGQPELDTVLDDPSIRQLRQRITFSYNLKPMDREAVEEYLRHRLAVAGYDGPRLFDPRAVDIIYQGSGGVPRLINILAHKSLMAAFGEGEGRIGKEHAKRAVEDTDDARTITQASLRTRLGQIWQRVTGWFGVLAALGIALDPQHLTGWPG